MTSTPATLLALAATVLILAPFLVSGVSKLLDFDGAVAEMRDLGLPAPMLVAVGVILLQLGASAAILLNLWKWPAAMALAGFTASATVLAHGGWSKGGPAAAKQRTAFFEHAAIIGGLCLIAFHDLGWM